MSFNTQFHKVYCEMKVIYNYFFFLKITFAPKSCATLVKGQNAWDDLKTHNTRFSFGF